MAAPDLHKFEGDLLNRPGPGSNAPPRTIRAKDLDENYKKVTLIESDKTPKLYELRYTKDGTRITRILPDLPDSSVMHVLTVTRKVLAWTPTEDC